MPEITSPALIKEVQKELAALNLYDGAIDGIAGKKTAAAVTKWQYLHNFTPTGIITEAIRRNVTVPQMFARQGDAPPPKVPKYPHDDTKSLTAFYGKPGDESKHQFISLPYPMKLAWEPSKEITRIRIHQKCAEDFSNFFNDIFQYYSLDKVKEYGLDMFGGSYNNRAIRGGSRASTHAFACAVDINPAENQLTWGKGRALFSRPEFTPLMQMATANNLVNLGMKRDFDFMHFEAAWVS